MTDRLMDGYDVVVLGGGAAGLSGALMLARARRSVVVIDAGAPRNAPATGVHGLLAREGIRPAELLERGRTEVRGYGGHVVSGEVAAVTREGTEPFEVTLADGRSVRARRLLVATGLVDELPDVPGLRERWGRDVLHCPYCHGWEVRDQAIGVLASGPMSVHQALLFRQWSEDVTFFSHTMPLPTGEEREQLTARGIRVVHGEVASLEIAGDRLVGVRLSDGTVVSREALAVAPRMVARTGFLRALGLTAREHPSGVGEFVSSDATGRTDASGVWVAGNVTDPAAQVGTAAAAGAAAAAQINADLVAEETRQAVADRAASEEFGKAFWEERYRGQHAPADGRQPNPQLVTETGELAPGTALDAGCGEGADAIWLASHGWRVTAVDIADAALRHARKHAETLGGDITSRIDWVQADLTGWVPPEEHFDLVSTHYVHVAADRAALFRRLAASVAPGGTLLIVGHQSGDAETAAPHASSAVHFTAEEIAADLDPERWDIAVTEARTRSAPTHDGHEVTLRDAVVRARRRP
ncbi:bifunctional NAD(P)/FAD-dependent oxidoreductase/class I SAM-dependent methyltransferase [Streptomyces sp. NPDC051322]|uniref:bifunctional NAD(P)/FAD-dependent oxidoreductase/class I SAM-dependent methyltransferase n=1 Tax=Streptomyces sp. NPDC051322 TaxID=3154645 RepID=UPI0034505615